MLSPFLAARRSVPTLEALRRRGPWSCQGLAELELPARLKNSPSDTSPTSKTAGSNRSAAANPSTRRPFSAHAHANHRRPWRARSRQLDEQAAQPPALPSAHVRLRLCFCRCGRDPACEGEAAASTAGSSRYHAAPVAWYADRFPSRTRTPARHPAGGPRCAAAAASQQHDFGLLLLVFLVATCRPPADRPIGPAGGPPVLVADQPSQHLGLAVAQAQRGGRCACRADGPAHRCDLAMFRPQAQQDGHLVLEIDVGLHLSLSPTSR